MQFFSLTFFWIFIMGYCNVGKDFPLQLRVVQPEICMKKINKDKSPMSSSHQKLLLILLKLLPHPRYLQYITPKYSLINIYRLFKIKKNSCMKTNTYQCVNCQISYQIEANYIEHYKSQHHRYNVKRKLIGLPPVSFEEYHLQFDDQKTSKQSVEQEFYCQICSKKFGNAGTYKQHIASKKHKLNRQNLKAQKHTLSKSSSQSDFQIIGAQKAETCLFCQTQGTKTHMKQAHNFPPFEHECINYDGLVEFVQGKLAKFECVYCHISFHSEESVRQHMNDLGHAKLNIENFGQYEKFYLWKIEQSSSEQDQQLTHLSPPKQEQSSLYEQLSHPTLQQLQQKRLARIKLTTTGAIINGKQVGYRHLKQYYKQYLNREIINLRQKYQPALQYENISSYKMLVKPPERAPKIYQNVNTR